MPDDLISFELNNGLKILLKEIHTAPLISSWIWYKVGSRYEQPGKTGISHWVEHMQFKGTPRFSSQMLDRSISRLGGTWNAFTNMDWTTYFETLPVGSEDIAFELESDRMVNSKFDPGEVEVERTVIISEREGAENNPTFLLDEAVQLEAILDHPYRNEVIGTKEDLHNLTRDDLYEHYQYFYRPSNATLCISGDIDPDLMQSKIVEYFDQIPSYPIEDLKLNPTHHPTQEKRIDICGPGETTFIQISYPAPKADSNDFFALSILDSLFTGPSGLNMFGSGSVGQKTSRIYQALVENEIAISAQGSLQATIDPYTYNIHLTLHPNNSSDELLQAFDEVVYQLQSNPPDELEIHKAAKQAKALFAYSVENITNQAFWMGYASSFASYDWFKNYIKCLSEVTPKDVQNAAQNYLEKEKRVIGIYHPNNCEKP